MALTSDREAKLLEVFEQTARRLIYDAGWEFTDLTDVLMDMQTDKEDEEMEEEE